MPARRRDVPASRPSTAGQLLAKAYEYVAQRATPLYHAGFVPLVIVVGLVFTEPCPPLVALLSPV